MVDSKETAWDFIQGENTGTFFSMQTKWVNKAKDYANKYPDEVQIIVENEDGSILVHALEGYFHFSRPRHVEYTEEQKEEQKERGKRLAQKKKEKTTVIIQWGNLIPIGIII